MSLDNLGNIYYVGRTTGGVGEPNGGSDDVFIMKLNSSGVLQWVTQLGTNTASIGGDNSGSDVCSDVTVDAIGNVYCAGFTSGNLGEPNAGSLDAFILKLNSLGEI